MLLYFKGAIQEFNNMHIFFYFLPRLRWKLFLCKHLLIHLPTTVWQVLILVFVQALHTLILFVVRATQGHNEFPPFFNLKVLSSSCWRPCRLQYCVCLFFFWSARNFFFFFFCCKDSTWVKYFDRICLHLKHMTQMSPSPLHYFSNDVIVDDFFYVTPEVVIYRGEDATVAPL